MFRWQKRVYGEGRNSNNNNNHSSFFCSTVFYALQGASYYKACPQNKNKKRISIQKALHFVRRTWKWWTKTKKIKIQRNKLLFVEKPETEIAHEYVCTLESRSMHTCVLTHTTLSSAEKPENYDSSLQVVCVCELCECKLFVSCFNSDSWRFHSAMNVILPGLEVNLDTIRIHNSVLTDFNHAFGAPYYKAHGSELRKKVLPYSP